MAGRRRFNIALVEVIGVSAAIHLAMVLLVGGWILFTYNTPDEEDFIAPPPEVALDLKKLKYQVATKKRSQNTAAPDVPKIQLEQVVDTSRPTVAVKTPTVHRRTMGRGRMGSGAGKGLSGIRGGVGGVGFGSSAVNFFGVKSKGERLLFIVDADDHMLEDPKGGMEAYQIVKDAIASMIGKLHRGTLFNVMMYKGKTVNMFSPGKMAQATDEQKAALAKWIQPFNADPEKLGAGENNFVPKLDVEPMGKAVSQFARAIQAGMEQDVDAIFIILSGWQFMGRGMTQEEREEWLRKEKDWSAKDEEEWQEAVTKSKEWLAKENAAREKAGRLPRIVHWIGIIVAEQFPEVRRKPGNGFDDEEVIDHIRNVAKTYYVGRDRPPVHVVLFLGKDEKNADAKAERIKEIAKKTQGRFKVIEGLRGLKNVTGR